MSSPAADRPRLAEGLVPPRTRAVDSSAFATLMLVLMTAVWGLSFSLMKFWHEAAARAPVCAGTFRPVLVSALTLILLRCGLAVLLLAAVRPALVRRPTRRAYAVGGLLGAICFAAFVTQISGLALISPARSAFLINLSCLVVPLLAWAWLGARPTPLLALGMALGLTGAVILTGSAAGAAGPFNAGDLLTIVAAVVFSIQIVTLDRFGRGEASHHFTIGFLVGITLLAVLGLAGVGLASDGLSLAGWAGWVGAVLAEPNMPWVLAGLVLTTSLSFYLMSSYQPRVGASRAALIYLMEIVFGAFFSVLLGYDRLTPILLLSGGLILAGNVLVEAPAWRRASRRQPARPAEEGARP